MADTVLGNVIEFFRELGVYDVVLPFILVFSIMYAILERTQLFGTEGKEKLTRKNLNAMIAFVIAFLVVASSKLVEVITQVSSQIIIVVLLVVFFLMLVGTFMSKEDIEKKGITLEGGWKVFFMFIVISSILVIFLNALKVSDGRTWLQVFWDWLSEFYTNSAVAAIVLIVAVIALMFWITRGKK